jgi:putative lipase involved disintegration of autophagic bodies
MASYARLARAAYNTESYSGDFKDQGYEIDHELSDKDRVTFYHAGSKKAVVSFRGTKVTNARDLIADYSILRGTQGGSARFKASTAHTRKVLQKYGKENVSLTGHSLGGSQAIHVGESLGLQAHAFNPGVGVKTGIRGMVRKIFRGKSAAPNTHIYHTGMKDPISTLSGMMPGNVKHVGPRFHKDPHSIMNFIF